MKHCRLLALTRSESVTCEEIGLTGTICLEPVLYGETGQSEKCCAGRAWIVSFATMVFA